MSQGSKKYNFDVIFDSHHFCFAVSLNCSNLFQIKATCTASYISAECDIQFGPLSSENEIL